ncbi:hypothetical protein [Chlorogloea sp. CCALA 695]|nr:hypothetical protein [Chlorogloea sp. CCALA 695]
MTLALTGRSHGETEPRKVTHDEAGHNKKTLTVLELKTRRNIRSLAA